VSSLREVQRALGAALLAGEETPSVEALVAGDGFAPGARLAIYRHHVFTSLTTALRATYPVVCRLVDERFFAYAAHEFIRANPPRTPCLFEYGGAFADFLAEFPPCRGLVYLPDVARLEWALTAAFHAPDFVPLDLTSLEDLDPEGVEGLTFELDPSLALLASPWPIDRIWTTNQPGCAETVVDLDSGEVRLAVRRAGDTAVFEPLSPARYALLRALTEGRGLGDALAAATADDPGLDAVATLRALFEDNVLRSFRLTRGEKERAS
jgi:hypothetical protein